MARILFYTPFNQRSRDTESLMVAFKHQGHHVVSLSQSTGNLIHDYLRTQGIETYNYITNESTGAIFYLKHIIFLIRFCSKHQIDVLYSHLESANFVASVANFFIRARVYTCRHHINEAALVGFNRSFLYRVTYKLAKKIIVVSDQASKYITTCEGIRPEKVIKINLAYDFSLYSEPAEANVGMIRRQLSSQLVLISVGRFTKYKRMHLSVLVLKKITDLGIDAKLILLGKGEEEAHIRALIVQHGLENRVTMPGYVHNVIDYLAVADFLLHPSLTEASCVVVKEAAITKLPVIVCSEIGDFDDYIINNANGFLTSQEKFTDEAAEIILENYNNKHKLKYITEALNQKVIDLFSIENIINHYEKLNNNG